MHDLKLLSFADTSFSHKSLNYSNEEATWAMFLHSRHLMRNLQSLWDAHGNAETWPGENGSAHWKEECTCVTKGSVARCVAMLHYKKFSVPCRETAAASRFYKAKCPCTVSAESNQTAQFTSLSYSAAHTSVKFKRFWKVRTRALLTFHRLSLRGGITVALNTWEPNHAAWLPFAKMSAVTDGLFIHCGFP